MNESGPASSSPWLRLRAQFVGREAHPAIQFIKYGIAGGLATVAHVTVFFILSLWIFPAMLADTGLDAMVVEFLGVEVPVIEEAARKRHFFINNIIAFLFGNVVAYLINFHWVFHPGRHRRTVEVTLFLAVSAISMFIGVQTGLLLMHYLLVTTTVAQLANVVASVMINFICRKYYIFQR